jgi:hypothetical protein
MFKTATPTRWFSAWRPASRVVQDDPADLGTAFGLDMSMMDDASLPSPAPAERRASGWAQRLGWRRHKPLA